MITINLNMELKKSQSDAFSKIKEFLKSDDNIFVLTGSAGTGKTALISFISQFLSKNKSNYRISAPTGKAAQVINLNNITTAVTIHSMIYNNKNTIENDKGSIQINFSIKQNDSPKDTIYIIDESSMISNNKSKSTFLNFGTGSLLDDLFTYINMENTKRKIIFTGDRFQLPPVYSSSSPALNIAYLRSAYKKYKIKEFNLNQFIRHEDSSTLLKNANIVKDKIINKTNHRFNFDWNNPSFNKIEVKDAIEKFIDDFDIDKHESIILSHTNDVVNKYNSEIHNKLFPNAELPQIHERIIIDKNNYLHGTLNGEMGMVKAVGDKVIKRQVRIRNQSPIVLVFQRISISFPHRTERKEISGYYLINSLINYGVEFEQNIANYMYIDFKNRHKSLKINSEKFLEKFAEDPFVNALRIKYGYALTVHKSQGSEWENVYFDFRNKCAHKREQFNRMVYTAITRSKKNFYAINV